MPSRDLRVTLVGEDNTGSAFGSAGNNADQLGSRWAGMGAKVAAAGAVIGAGLVTAGTHLFQTGQSLELLQTKIDTVFGDQVGVVQQWADQTAAAMGLTTREAQGLAAGFADLLIPMGFTREQAAKMSTDVVGLSGALAEWTGGQKSAAEVADILSAAMLGETDGLKSLGISIGAADVEARLLTKGQQNLTGAARQQAEAQAIQTLIMEKSTDAQNAFKNGSGSLARQQAETSAKFREARDDLAVKLLPAFTSVAAFITDEMIPAISSTADWFQRNQDVIVPLVAVLGSAAAALGVVVGVVKAYTIAQTALNFVLTANPIGILVVGLAALAAAVIIAYQRSETFRTIVQAVFKAVATSVLTAVDIWLGALQKVFAVMGKIPGVGGKFKAVADAIQGARDKVDDLKSSLERLPAEKTIRVNAVVNGLNSLDAVAAKLSRLDGARASGGPVRAGGAYLVGEQGPEIVVPRRSGMVIPNHALGYASATTDLSPLLRATAAIVDEVRALRQDTRAAADRRVVLARSGAV